MGPLFMKNSNNYLIIIFIVISSCYISSIKSQMLLNSINRNSINNDTFVYLTKKTTSTTTAATTTTTSANSNLLLLSNNNNNNNKDLSSTTINDLITKCSSMTSLDKCDMCSLCQNGAFCKQNVAKKHQKSPLNRPIDSLAVLRSLIDFTCYCVPGYTGTYCQIDINECLSQPCSNNATCIDRINTYECRCPNGFTGDHCEININECDSSPCMFGGKCVDLIDGYYCQCPTGYTGPTCSININDCESNPCQNGAKCIDKVNSYECNCSNTGFEGKHCDVNINDCINVKCKHNATCLDQINGFKCDCFEGFEGKYCEVDINECKSMPCLNGGLCWQHSDPKQFERYLKYTKNKSSPLKSEEFSYSKSSGYWCECKPGFSGSNCDIKINECQSNPCGFNGMCIDLVNDFKCVCYPGYTGKTCSQNIDECSLYSPCAPDTNCMDIQPDYHNLLTNLFNQQKLTGINYSNSTTTNKNNIDQFILDYNHKMLYSPQSIQNDSADRSFIHSDGYQCDCSDLNENLFQTTGTHDVIYAGQNCTLKLNACESMKHLCKHGSTCVSVFNDTSSQQDIVCSCQPGYIGKYCEHTTSFRMDGSYSINHSLVESINDFDLKFEFRLNFFHKYQHKLPFLYFESQSNLVFEIIVLREYFHIKNDLLNLNEKMAFYFNYSNSVDNEYDSTSIWHGLRLTKLSNDSLKIVYSVKKIQLKEEKIIQFNKSFSISSFTIGKFYSINNNNDKNQQFKSSLHKNNNYLSGACFRDFILNEDYIIKSDGDDIATNKIKYGCDFTSNQCKSKPKVCQNNAVCVYKWFDHECIKCERPFYGKNCQFESTKLAFVNPNTINPNNPSPNNINNNNYMNTFNYYYTNIRSEFTEPVKQPYLMLSSIIPMQPKSDHFKIQFKFIRIYTQVNNQRLPASLSLQSNDKVSVKQFTFLLLKQKLKSSPTQASVGYEIFTNPYASRFKLHYYYLVSINQEGYLELKKIQSEYDLNDFDYNMSNKYKTLWTLKNDKINLNQLSSSFGFKTSIKLNNNFLELSINGTHLSRFELINKKFNTESQPKFEIETVIFSCFDSTFYSSRNDMTFMIQDLTINNNYFEFDRSDLNSSSIKLVLLDSQRNFILQEDSGSSVAKQYLLDHSYLDLFGYNLDENELINQLNSNPDYCKLKNDSLLERPNRTITMYSYKNIDQLDNVPNNTCYLTNYMKMLSYSLNKNYVQTIQVKNSQLNNNLGGGNPLSDIVYNQIKNVSCHLKKPSRIQSINNNYYHNMPPSLSYSDIQTTSFSQSTCQKYATLQRNLYKLHSNTFYDLVDSSHVNYYFDFDESNGYVASAASGQNSTSTTNGYEQDEMQGIDFEMRSSMTKQRRLILYKDVEFYSLAFNLNLNTNKDINENVLFLSNEEQLKFNLFTLNTFDDLTTNRIFLFGLNMFVNTKLNTTQFEIFTNKQSINTTQLMFKPNLYLNVTFTFNSIELRFDKRDDYVIRLTDRYFNLFFRSLLKAYGSFQLNVTSQSTPVQVMMAGTNLNDYMMSACINNFILVTRRPYINTLNNSNSVNYAYDFYNLIDQTKSISFFQSKSNEIYFDKCSNDFGLSNSKTSSIGNNSGLSRIMSTLKYDTITVSTPISKPGCYLISKYDVLMNQKLNDFYDCNCTNSNCSYLFWSNEDNDDRLSRFSSNSLNTIESVSSCNNTKEFACFNNGRCVDTFDQLSSNNLQPEPSYKCICQSGYVGKRFVNKKILFFKYFRYTRYV